eukprot:Selendium_serpulae@DN285_c0_g1_i1.p1
MQSAGSAEPPRYLLDSSAFVAACSELSFDLPYVLQQLSERDLKKFAAQIEGARGEAAARDRDGALSPLQEVLTKAEARLAVCDAHRGELEAIVRHSAGPREQQRAAALWLRVSARPPSEPSAAARVRLTKRITARHLPLLEGLDDGWTLVTANTGLVRAASHQGVDAAPRCLLLGPRSLMGL